ncbi:hypothetical protein KCU64_g10176, partial [Aureobasidium melanogenum]
MLKTTEFDLHKFYAGDSPGAFDTWANHGWTRDDWDMSSPNTWDPSWLSCPPPAYVPTSLRDLPHTAQNKIHHPDRRGPLSPVRTPTPLLPPEHVFSSNDTADLLVGLSTGSTPQLSDLSKDVNVTYEPTPKTHSAVPQTLRYVSHRSFARENRAIGPSSSSMVPDTPTRKRPLGLAPKNVGESDAKRLNRASLTEPQHGIHSPPVWMYYRGVKWQAVTLQSPTEIDTVLPPSSHLSSSQSGLDTSAIPLESAGSLITASIMPSMSHHQRMTLWLVRTWKLYPSAHYKLIPELLKLGDAAHKDDDRAFHDCLVAFTVAATEYCVRENVRTHVNHLCIKPNHRRTRS